MNTREEALAVPHGNLAIAMCQGCGFITNTAFEADRPEYSARYEETQGFSGTFSRFATDLAQRLIDRYGLRGKRVLEIGCGKGEFLAVLCQLGENHGVGVDPSWLPDRLPAELTENIDFHAEFYGPQHAAIATDFIACRHTLEHIPNTQAFVQQIRDNASSDTPVWIEVPDVLRVLREGAFWDIYYEHCSYFTLGSLARLYRNCGLDVCELGLEYDDQYLVIGGQPVNRPQESRHEGEDDLAQIRDAVDAFGAQCSAMVDGWRKRLTGIRKDGGLPVIWGAGSKGVAFLSTLRVGDTVPFAVDVNPHKAGKFLPGTGHEVVSPNELPTLQPTHVVVMNPIYEAEIRENLRALGVDAEVLVVTDPGA